MRQKLLSLFLFVLVTPLIGQPYSIVTGHMINTPGGATNYINLGDDTDRNFGSSGQDFTLEFWVKDGDASGDLFANSNGNLTIERSAQTVTVTLKNGGSTQTLTGTINNGTWGHVGLVMKDGPPANHTVVLWIDQTVADSTDISFYPDLSSGEWYAGYIGSGSNYASASFDEIRFWNVARTADEFRTYIHDTIHPEDDRTNLVGYFKFSGSGTTVSDSSDTDADGSLVGTGFTRPYSTAPCPFYTIGTTKFFNSATWADGQGTPPNTVWTNVHLRNNIAEFGVGDAGLNIGTLVVDFDSIVASTPGSRLRRHVNYSNNHQVRNLVIVGRNHQISNDFTVTNSITTRSHPGNCLHCGPGELTIQRGGNLIFTGGSITFHGTLYNYGISRITNSGHSFNGTNSTINMYDGGLFLSTASGSNSWTLTGTTVNVFYGGGISVTGSSTSISGGTFNMYDKFQSGTEEWRQISSPKASGTLADFSDDVTLNFNGAQTNVFSWDGSENDGSGNANGWTAATATGNSFSHNTAYTLYVDNTNFTLLNSGEMDVTGTPFSGDYTHTVYNYQDPNVAANSQNKGWNLIPNPYPGAISVSTLINDYNGDGSETDNAGTEWPLDYKAVHAWDARNGQYQAYTASGQSTITHDANLTVGSFSNYIRPFNAFWVKMGSGDATSESLVVKNAHRTQFRMTSGKSEFHKLNGNELRLNVFDVDSAWDQVLISFDANSTYGWDPGREAYDLKSMAANMPNLEIPTADGLQSIASFPTPQGTEASAINLTSGKAGIHYVSLDDRNLDPSLNVYLVDSISGTVTDLKNQTGMVNIATAAENRELWIVYSHSTQSIETWNTHQLTVGTTTDAWIVYTESGTEGTLEVRDLSGRLVSRYEVSTPEFQFEKPLEKGVYIITLSNENGLIGTTKKVAY